MKVSAKVGDYSFTLTSENKVKTVIVHVIDATMPASYTFEKWREDDIGSMANDSDIKSNTTHVKGESKTTFTDTKTEVNGDITFNGNVNTMKGSTETGKFYRVRIKLDDKTDINAVKAVSKDGTREYTVTPVSNAEHTIFVDLDAEEAITELVIANKNASKEQIEKETTSCHTVTFESTSKIWLRGARASGQNNTINNTSVTMAEVNKKDTHTVDVGVKFDKLEKVKITDNKDTASKDDNGDYWVPIILKLNETTIDIQKSVYIDETSDIVLNDTLTVGGGQEILIWVKSNKTQEQEINFTLHYNRAGETNREDLPVTVILHDASAPKIVSVAPGDDDNAKALSNNLSVIPTETAGDNRVRKDNITVDTYKYGMKVVTHTDYTGKEVEGRWYSLKLTFNVPVESILFNNSGNKGTEQANKETWQPFTEVSGNEVTIWIDRDAMEKGVDKTTNTVEQTLCNKWSIEKDGNEYKQDGTGTNAKWTVGVTITETEKTYVGLHDKNPIGTANLNNTYNYSAKSLQGITVVEKIKDGLINESLNNTLTEMAKLSYNNGLSYDSKTNTATIKLPINKISEITVNDQKGRWMVAYLNVTSKTIEDENGGLKNGIFVDKNNIQNLVKSENLLDGYYRVPVWIDLKNDNVLKAIKTETNPTPTPIEIKFSHSTPVKETNSLKVVFEDDDTASAPALDLSETTSPKTATLPKLDSLQAEEKKVEYEKWLGNADTSETDIQQADLNKLANNESKVKNISYETYGNTVYVKITADLAQLEDISSKGKIIPLELDISALSNETGDIYIHLDKYAANSWGKCSENEDYKGNTFYLGATYDSNKNGCEDIYITKGTVQNGSTKPEELTTPYIHYVIEFVQG